MTPASSSTGGDEEAVVFGEQGDRGEEFDFHDGYGWLRGYQGEARERGESVS